MKMKTQFSMVSVVLLFVLFTGCASLGQDQVNLANQARRQDNPALALAYASEALVINPDLTSAKNFLRNNGEELLAQSYSSIEQSLLADDLAGYELRFLTYTNLDKFYNDLRKIGLPITRGSRFFGLIKGWKWSVPLRDHSENVARSREEGRSAFMAAAEKALQNAELDLSKSHFDKVIDLFAVAGSEELKNDLLHIADLYVLWAEKIHGSQDPERLLDGIQAYELALRYNPQEERATEGRAALHNEISEAYLALGLEKESRGDVKSLLEAIEYMKLSLKYNAANDAADIALERVETSLADAYYNEGVELAKDFNSTDKLARAVEYMLEVQKLVPDFKDASMLEQRYLVGIEVIKLDESLADTISHFNLTERNMRPLISLINVSHDGMLAIDQVVDSIIQLDKQIETIGQVLTVMVNIPKVGTALYPVNTSLRQARRPITPVAEKCSRIKNPIVKPSVIGITELKGQSDSLNDSLNNIKASLLSVQGVRKDLFVVASRIDDEYVLIQVQETLKVMKEALDELQHSFNEIAEVQNELSQPLTALSDGVSVVDNVSGGVRNIMRPLNQIKGITDDINGVLQRRINIGIYRGTVANLIDSTVGVVSSAIDRLLSPIFNRLNIRFPDIPGLDQFDRLMDELDEYNRVIQQAKQRLSATADRTKNASARLASGVLQLNGLTGYEF